MGMQEGSTMSSDKVQRMPHLRKTAVTNSAAIHFSFPGTQKLLFVLKMLFVNINPSSITLRCNFILAYIIA